MPQRQLPIFPEGVTQINSELAFQKREGKVWYFNGHLPVFNHDEHDVASFRLFSSQLVINGTAKQSQISRSFGVPLITVKRYVKQLRQEGSESFFRPAKRRNGQKLTPERLEQARKLLEAGWEVPEVAEELEVLANTLHKAIRAGRLPPKAEKKRMMPGSSRRQQPRVSAVKPMHKPH